MNFHDGNLSAIPQWGGDFYYRDHFVLLSNVQI